MDLKNQFAEAIRAAKTVPKNHPQYAVIKRLRERERT